MGSTDVGDYFPDKYENEIDFEDGMGGSQAKMGGNRDGPALPGMENLGEGAYVTGGIEMASEIPEGMTFIPSSVLDGEYPMNVASTTANGAEMEIAVKPVCMTYEDFFVAFAPGSHPSLSVSPPAGRMDRRGGELTFLTVKCMPNGQSGDFGGVLVINLVRSCHCVSKISFILVSSPHRSSLFVHLRSLKTTPRSASRLT
jgi:hypothetical protein